jgi:general secretion pathway protein C
MAGLTRSTALRRWLVPARPLRRPPDLHGGHALVAALGALCAVLAIRLLVAMFAPAPLPPPVVEPTPADPSILARLDPFFGVAAADAMPVTSLPLKLRGVRTDGASGRGGAFIEGADGAQGAYSVGDSVGGAILAAVAEDHVILDNGGRRETLWIDSGGSAAPAEGGAAPVAAPISPTAAQTAPVPAAGRGMVLVGEAARAKMAADPDPPASLGDDAQ